ncbi:MAG TPA: LuxR C-terminal-related transcriptional regulator [Vicinamibacterales bacterium]|nr:LuxR C-terminal-related transcriptional regulator [Vicinamibacterales bacterium]
MLLITPSERQTLRLLSQEKASGEIARCLGITTSEVGPYLTALFARMGAASRSEAVSCAVRRGLLGDDEI